MKNKNRLENLRGYLLDYEQQYHDEVNEPFLLDIYTTFVELTRTYPIEYDEEHVKNGFQAEVGEVAGVLAKYARGDFNIDERNRRLVKELGDVFYYFVKMCKIYDFDPYQVAYENMLKLVDRFEGHTVAGDGDDR